MKCFQIISRITMAGKPLETLKVPQSEKKPRLSIIGTMRRTSNLTSMSHRYNLPLPSLSLRVTSRTASEILKKSLLKQKVIPLRERDTTLTPHLLTRPWRKQTLQKLCSKATTSQVWAPPTFCVGRKSSIQTLNSSNKRRKM